MRWRREFGIVARCNPACSHDQKRYQEPGDRYQSGDAEDDWIEQGNHAFHSLCRLPLTHLSDEKFLSLTT